MSVMKAERDSLSTAAGFESKSFTYFMRSNIFPKIARNLGLLAWNREYYALDGMFYEERGRDHSGKYTTYAKWISVALEHETKHANTLESIAKLQMFNAPLKVLTTYAAEGVESDSLLLRYAAVIGESDIFNDFSSLRQQLVIIGTPKTLRDWRFYVYESDGFVLMLPGYKGEPQWSKQSTAPYAALILRVSLGIMFLAHVGLKIFVFTIPGFVGFFPAVPAVDAAEISPRLRNR
jgi:hypothetical protein